METAEKITAGSKVRVEKGCKARGVDKGARAVVEAIEPLGADYSYSVRVKLKFLNTFLAGKSISFYARHENRLGDVIISLNDGRPEHKVQISRIKEAASGQS